MICSDVVDVTQPGDNELYSRRRSIEVWRLVKCPGHHFHREHLPVTVTASVGRGGGVKYNGKVAAT